MGTMNGRGSTNWLTQKQIKIGSIWIAANGGNYGHKVVGYAPAGDLYVQPLVKGKPKGELTTIDFFKLQYRYKPAQMED